MPLLLALLQDTTPLDPQVVRLGAALLLLAYIVFSLIFLPREITFLRSVEEPFWRRSFVVQDSLIQLGVLLVLLPCIVAPQLLTNSMWPYVLILSGVTLLWGGWLWAALSRYSYTYRLLTRSTHEFEDKQRELMGELMKKERKSNDGS